MTPVLILSAGLMTAMVAVEIIHFRLVRRITFLTAVHILIAIGYCLPPFLVTLLPDTPWQYGPRGPLYNPWGMRLYLLDLADHLRLPSGAYLTAFILLIGGYVALLFGYLCGTRLPIRPFHQTCLPVSYLAALGMVLLGLAGTALGLYGSQFGSLSDFYLTGPGIRSGEVSAKWGALQILAQIALPAFLVLTAAAVRSTGTIRWLLGVLAAVAWAVAFARMWHASGRLELGSFLLIPLVATVFMLKSKKWVVLAAAAIGLLALLIASAPHHSFSHLHLAIPKILNSLASNLLGTVISILAEFGFPHIASAHTLTVVPDPISFRYFIDIPLGLLYMLPNLTGVETLPPMVLSLAARLLPWIPVDLLSLGYFSLGALGVLIIFIAFGAVLALFDGWLSESAGWLGQALRAAWLFYLPFRLFYADPYAALQSGFGLIAGTVLIMAMALWAAWRRRGA